MEEDKFDAEEAGAFVIPETSVDDVIRKGGKIVEARTGREDGDLYADVVIGADGVNSLLSKGIASSSRTSRNTRTRLTTSN